LVERLLCKQNVIGSNPVTSTIFRIKAETLKFGKAEKKSVEIWISGFQHFRISAFISWACSSVG
jgi:hypothetical protein